MNQISMWAETTKVGMGHVHKQSIGIIDGQIVFMQISARTTVGFDYAAADKQPVFEQWNNWLDSKIDAAPTGMKDYRMNCFAWVWMVSEQAFVQTAVQGIAIAILFASIVLLAAT